MFNYKAYVPHGITFIDIKTDISKHTWRDWKIVPTSRPIFDPPEIRTITQEIPGMDGLLDLSQSLTGEINYNNRTGSFEFYVENKDNWKNVYSEIANFLHGKDVRIILDDDPDFFYKGITNIDIWESDKYESRITINADVYPYKLKNVITEVTRTVTDYLTIVCNNLRKSVIPEITASSPMSLSFLTSTFSIPSGTCIIPEMRFAEGDNIINVTGTGTITIKYQEGSL